MDNASKEGCKGKCRGRKKWPCKKKMKQSCACWFHVMQATCSSETYSYLCGVSWLITTSSGFDDWIYWHFFAITINYNSSRSVTV
jgi:hypothetical protein